jgi:SAM-dependent methyltransferase
MSGLPYRNLRRLRGDVVGSCARLQPAAEPSSTKREADPGRVRRCAFRPGCWIIVGVAEVPLYDEIGGTYTVTRREDARIAQAILAALGDAASVANVGAGTGNYEPRDREVVAIEPSAVMIGQRAGDAAAAIHGFAERIPLDDGGVDAAMAVLSDQHWDDCRAGLAEMRRIARRRVVALTLDYEVGDRFWLTQEYLPEARSLRRPDGENLYALAAGGGAAIDVVPVPWDCSDGFFLAYWRRPRAYLDPVVRAGISVFHLLDSEYVEHAMARLADDLASGEWRARHEDLLDLEELDLGLRLIVWPAP